MVFTYTTYLNFKNLYILPKECVYDSNIILKIKIIILLNSINLCNEVPVGFLCSRSEFLNIIWTNFSFQTVNVGVILERYGRK
jgi:hypothetical protein